MTKSTEEFLVDIILDINSISHMAGNSKRLRKINMITLRVIDQLKEMGIIKGGEKEILKNGKE